MSLISQNISKIRHSLKDDVELVAVSKFHPAEAIEEAYAADREYSAKAVCRVDANNQCCLLISNGIYWSSADDK